ncbi:MAG: MetQ/NlpA family ABC transporter substrate-binding protein [Gammaproteobacteria bacterium]|nr:MetQ/NlpA family ABC transporter substrate-binding protein [Gammaproteobacteria bacterium]
MIKTIRLLLCALSLLWLTACNDNKAANKNTIKVGTIAGAETQLMETAKQVAQQRYHLTVTIVPFTSYSLPNQALADGDIDANMFQHKPFLDADSKAHGYKLVIIGKTFVYPIAVYSDKLKKLNQLPDHGIVAIPNDASNEARALLLLQKAGLIKLRRGSGITAVPKDIISNPKHLQFKELTASTLTRALPDVSIAVINTTYASLAGLSPTKNGLFVEGADSPYANIVVVRAGEQDKLQFKQLIEALHSPQVLAKAHQLFKDGAVPAWKVVNKQES